MSTSSTSIGSVPAGVTFARFIKALAAGRGDPCAAEAFGMGAGWHNTPAVLTALKAAVSALSEADLVAGMAGVNRDFAQYLRPLTIVGRLQRLRRVPFATRMVAAGAGTGAAWTGEAAPIPVSKLTLSDAAGEQLLPLKVGGIAVITMELARRSDPVADAVIATDVAAGIVEAMDRAFIDPANAGVADAKPAAVAHGAQSFESRGSTIAAIDADLADMVGVLTEADLALSTAAWVMHPKSATALALMRGADGAPAYPAMTARGGVLLGLPVLTSTACAASGSPGERFISLLEASEILLADDGESEISVTGDATVQMDDAPGSGAQQAVSLWQSGLVGVLGRRWLNWKPRRAGAVAVLRSVNF